MYKASPATVVLDLGVDIDVGVDAEAGVNADLQCRRFGEGLRNTSGR